jgi:hypothetical protein
MHRTPGRLRVLKSWKCCNRFRADTLLIHLRRNCSLVRTSSFYFYNLCLEVAD